MPDASAPADKLSGVEGIKRASRQLRGGIARSLQEGGDRFSEDDGQLLKTHGIYQQYDRDTATPRKKQGLDREYQMMARLRVPGGRLDPDQYLALDTLAEELGNTSLRVTTRQTFQYHGVVKGDLHALIHRINRQMLTTVAACGDVVRNVMATPAPINDAVHETLNRISREVSTYFEPRSTAYHEIWVDGEPVDPGDGWAKQDEPIYGEVYLPRKFKIALAHPDDNSVDVFCNDVGIVALFDGDDLQGFNVLAGGGLGMTHNKPKTYPRLASPLLFVEPDGLIGAVEAIVKVQRDRGDRSDRKHARLKYTIDDMGLPAFKAAVDAMAGRTYAPPRPMPRFRIVDHRGWHTQGDGRWYLGVPIPSGRIVDVPGGAQYRTALRDVVDRYRTPVVLTPQQDVILADIRDEDRPALEAELRGHGLVMNDDLAPLERWALACPALPTCGLALTEAERVRQPIVASVLERLQAHGLGEEAISLRITGCPNGCARPYAGDIGLVGRMPGHYALYVGGDFEGTRLSERVLDKVAEADIPAVLDPLFAAYAGQRQAVEGFGDWCNRVGLERLRRIIGEALPAVAI